MSAISTSHGTKMPSATTAANAAPGNAPGRATAPYPA